MQNTPNASDTSDAKDWPAERARYVAELAALGQLVLDLDGQVAQQSAENLELRKALSRSERALRKASAQGDTPVAKPADPAEMRRLAATIERKEQEAFVLREQVGELQEVLAHIDVQLRMPQGPRVADAQTAEIARLSRMVMDRNAALREAQEQIADLDLKLAASTAVGTQTTEAQIAVGAASESRALLTRLVAERDRLVAQ